MDGGFGFVDEIMFFASGQLVRVENFENF